MKRREFIQDGAITAATVVVAGTMGCATGKVSTDQQAEMGEAELLPSAAEALCCRDISSASGRANGSRRSGSDKTICVPRKNVKMQRNGF